MNIREKNPKLGLSCNNTANFMFASKDIYKGKGREVRRGTLNPTILSNNPTILSNNPTILANDPKILANNPTILANNMFLTSHRPKNFEQSNFLTSLKTGLKSLMLKRIRSLHLSLQKKSGTMAQPQHSQIIYNTYHLNDSMCYLDSHFD